MTRQGKTKFFIAAVLCTIVLTALDQFTKWLAVRHLQEGGSVSLIPDVFELQYLENRGAAFGIFQNQRLFFVIMTLIILAAALYCLWISPFTRRYLPVKICMIFICAGALGNLIDRVIRGYVIDFFSFTLINFPVFNVADIYITVSFAFLILFVFFYYKEEELSLLVRPQADRQHQETK